MSRLGAFTARCKVYEMVPGHPCRGVWGRCAVYGDQYSGREGERVMLKIDAAIPASYEPP